MFNQNLQSIFMTSPEDGQGTSVYLVQQNGLIRAKTKANELHVRPGKNIYFIREADVSFFDNDNIRVVYNAETGFTIHIAYSSFSIAATTMPTATQNVPIDMYLNGDGTCTGGAHIGHPVTQVFNGTCGDIGTITLNLVLYRIISHVNDLQQGDFSLGNDQPVVTA